MKMKWIKIFSLVLILASVYSVMATHRKPNFRWVVYKTPLYEYALYDGEEPIGYFSKQSLSFYEFKLIPGVVSGRFGNYGIGLYAQNQYWGRESLTIKEFAVDTSDPTRFVMKVHAGQKMSGEKEDELDIESMLEVTWDAQLKCYSWWVTKKMTVLGGNTLKEGQVEFEDTYLTGTYADDQRYEYFVRKAADGNHYMAPLNHDKSTDKIDWDYAKDGFWVACLDGKTNPALEWFEGRTENLKSATCWLSQDIHHYWLSKNGTFKVGETKTVKYRFVNYPYEKAKEILAKSKFRDLPNDPLKNYPMREWPLSRFDKNVYRITKVGVYAWCPSKGFDDQEFDPKCIWDKTTGYDDSFSLKIDASDGEIHTWRCTAVDYQPSIPIKGKSRFSFMVKTKDLKGYARLVYRNVNPPTPPLISNPISGTNDWTRVSLDVPEGYWLGANSDGYRTSGNTDLYFEVKGPGVAWFDNLLREIVATK